MKSFTSPDGTVWSVDVQNPGASNAIVVFHHPGGTGRYDRYNWLLWHGPESQNVTARLDAKRVLDGITSEQLERLFRRSMPVDAKKSGVSLVAV